MGHQIEIFKMRFFNFSLLVFVVLLSLGRAEEQKTSLTSRDYKKLFSQRFNRINKPIISDDEDFGPSGDDEELSGGSSGDGEETEIFELEVIVPQVVHEKPYGRKILSPPVASRRTPKPTQKPTTENPGNSAQTSFLLVNFLVILITLL